MFLFINYVWFTFNLVSKQLTLRLHLRSVDLSFERKFAVWTREEYWIFEAEGTFVSDETLVCLVCKVPLVQFIILLESLSALSIL